MKSSEKIKELESYLAVYKELYQTSCELYEQKIDAENCNYEIRSLLEESMQFLIDLPVDPEKMSLQEMVARNIYYRDNLYAFILEKGLLKELADYHKSVDMLSPGGHERIKNYLKSHLSTEEPDFDPSCN
jgi:hypothetical protein